MIDPTNTNSNMPTFPSSIKSNTKLGKFLVDKSIEILPYIIKKGVVVTAIGILTAVSSFCVTLCVIGVESGRALKR